MAKNRLEILFQDDDFVAVQKPAGLATIPGRAEDDSVLERLGRELKIASSGTSDPRLRVVHRLDKETSGVLLFAKNIAAQRHVSEQFQNNTTEKEYLAIVAGRPYETTGEVNASIAPHRSAPQRMSIVKTGGRPAKTLWKLEQTFRDFSLVRAYPKTGKTHQIRIHLKHAGIPLAIDQIYNPAPLTQALGIFLSRFKAYYSPTAGELERPLIARLTLHAEKLRFTHLNGQPIEIIAPPPKDFRATVNMLTRHSSR